MSTIQNYAVSGMSCDHCIHAVTSELAALPGVLKVTVDLASPGGDSNVRVVSAEPLTTSDVAGAIDEAGYDLVDPDSRTGDQGA